MFDFERAIFVGRRAFFCDMLRFLSRQERKLQKHFSMLLLGFMKSK